jgi:hypothetical protein
MFIYLSLVEHRFESSHPYQNSSKVEQIHEYVLCGIYGELDSLEGELSV